MGSMKFEKKNVTVRLGTIVAFSSLFLLFFMLFISFILIYRRFDDSEETGVKMSREYRYFEVNPHKNQTSSGFISIFDDLETPNDFISYKDSDGKFILISNFESDEYYCTGKCYCESTNSRKSFSSSSHFATRRLFYLVASLSSVLAIQKAKEYFDDECRSSMSEVCSSSNAAIRSEVDICEKRLETSHTLDGDLLKDLNIPKMKKYWCKAPCERVKGLRPFQTKELDRLKVECRDEVMKAEVILYPQEVPDVLTDIVVVRRKFRNDHLIQFCNYVSTVKNKLHFPNQAHYFKGKNICRAVKKSSLLLVCVEITSGTNLNWNEF